MKRKKAHRPHFAAGRAALFGVNMKDHANIEARQPTDAEVNQMVDDLRMQFLNALRLDSST